MRPSPRLLGLGAVLTALALAFWFGGRAAAPASADARPVLRVAHTLLQSGARDALAAIAQDYERHTAATGQPWRVELLAVPERAYPQWLRTQLVGGTAPEVVMLNAQEDDALNVRYFAPLSAAVELPNPHNDSTPLAGQPWRDTFLDGLDNAGFNFRLGEHFAIPLSVNPPRLFVNRTLLAELLAAPEGAALAPLLSPDGLPRDYDAFLAACEAVRAFATARDRPLVPIAGSRFNAPLLLDALFTSQTQRLLHDPVWLGRAYPQASVMPALEALRTGRVGPRHPAFQSGFTAMREIGRHFQPGFAQQQRDDATFLFCAGRALFIAANAWDAATFRALAVGDFAFDALSLPQPGRDHPRYGAFVFGPRSEADAVPAGTFGVVAIHPAERQARALDFLRYLTSLRANEKFAALSGWLPALSGARVPAAAEAFRPRARGYSAGPNPHFSDPDLRALLERHLHLLVGDTGGVEAFTAAVERTWAPAVQAAIERTLRRNRAIFTRQDSLLAAEFRRAPRAGDAPPSDSAEPPATTRLDSLLDATLGLEADYFFFQNRAHAAGRTDAGPR